MLQNILEVNDAVHFTYLVCGTYIDTIDTSIASRFLQFYMKNEISREKNKKNNNWT